MFTLRYIDSLTRRESIVAAKSVHPIEIHLGPITHEVSCYSVTYLDGAGHHYYDIMTLPSASPNGGTLYVMNGEGKTVAKYKVVSRPPRFSFGPEEVARSLSQRDIETKVEIEDNVATPSTTTSNRLLQYGRWMINFADAQLWTMQNAGGDTYYESLDIPIGDLKTSAAILDWIFQLRVKTWMSSADVGDLVTALHAISGQVVCSFGIDHPIDPIARLQELKKKIDDAATISK